MNGTIKMSEEVMSRLRDRNVMKFDACSKCPVKCGGGCTNASFMSYNRLDIPGEYAGKCNALKLILYKYLYRKLVSD